jgi:hypothetical protein
MRSLLTYPNKKYIITVTVNKIKLIKLKAGHFLPSHGLCLKYDFMILAELKGALALLLIEIF